MFNYEEKIRNEIERKGGDSSLFDTFLAIEKLYYVNKDVIESFSLWDFVQKLKEEGNENKSIFLYSDFCNQKLSLKGCLTLETGIENDHKMTIFSKLKVYLSDRFPEFNFLGDVRSLPCDLTKEEILKLIENKSNNLKKYIYNLLESLNLDSEENHDKVIDIIHQHVENLLSLDEQHLLN